MTQQPKSMDDEEALVSLLQEWTHHSHADYHNFSNQEATEIRSTLLHWYTANRRKLPWRGDPPPFDGSTSGINNVDSKKKGKTKVLLEDTTQKSITSFFNATQTTKAKSKKPAPSNDGRSKSAQVKQEETQHPPATTTQAIPVTGYGVWVSEIMLQQTRVEAVIPYWIRWMESFPTVHDLANATEETVNAHWAGLGFYRRARLLHQGAKYVVDKLEGQLPKTPEGLSQLPGIGPYTAAAIASIAYDVCVPVVDGNVCRVLSRLTGIANHIKHPMLKDKLGWKLAAQIVEAGDGSSPGLVNQALMELGATYCAPSGTGVDDRDPLRDYYLSTKLGRAVLLRTMKARNNTDVLELLASPLPEDSCPLCDPDARVIVLQQLQERITRNMTMEEAAKVGHTVLPIDPPKMDKREEDLAMAVISIVDDSDDNSVSSRRYLMVKRPSTGLLAGQWEFPNVCVQTRNGKGGNNKKKSRDETETTSSAPPTKASRKRALSTLLKDDLFGNYTDEEIVGCISDLARTVATEPLEHIFSHVRHFMWLESGILSVQSSTVHKEALSLEWTSVSGRKVRWMHSDDMKAVGITSGVTKVLKAVNQTSPTKKRKR